MNKCIASTTISCMLSFNIFVKKLSENYINTRAPIRNNFKDWKQYL